MVMNSSATCSLSQSSERRQFQQQQKRRLFQEHDWTRSDGRSFHQCRPAFLRTGATNAAAGSAYAEFGSTKGTVSVFGPRESDLPVIISCASLALADAGIMMYDLVSAVSVNLVIDLVAGEEACQDGNLMITCMPSRYEITQLTLTREWSTAKINEAMELCLDACSKLANIMRPCLKEST